MLGQPYHAETALEAARYLCNPGSELDASLELCLLQLQIARCDLESLSDLRRKVVELAQAHPRGSNAMSYDTLMLILQATTIDKISRAKWV